MNRTKGLHARVFQIKTAEAPLKSCGDDDNGTVIPARFMRGFRKGEVRGGRRVMSFTGKCGLALFFAMAVSPVFAAVAGDIIINEIMYNDYGSGTDWIEIYNSSTSNIDLTGWKVWDGDGTTWHGLTFTQGGSTISAGGYAIVAENATTFLSGHAASAGVGSWIVIDSGGLTLGQSGTDTVALSTAGTGSTVISSVTYGVASPWPTGVEGYSIERKVFAGTDSDPTNWVLGPSSGTPAALNVSGGGSAVTTEISCINGVDDDGDGMVDCADGDCAADTACVVPGATNSTAKVLEVDDSRNPFSPYDKDSAYRLGRILFNVYAADVIKTIRIVNVRGESVRMLINNDMGPSNASYTGVAGGLVTWDGRDDEGNLVPVGIYIVFLEGVNPGTGDRVTARDTIAVGRPF